MKSLLVLTLISFSAIAGICHAAEWNEMDDLPSTFGLQVFVDDASYDAKGAIRQAWVRMDYTKPREKEGRMLKSYFSHRIVNCDTRRYYITQSYGFAAESGEEVPFNTLNQEWLLAVPDTESDIAMAAICHEPRNDFGSED